MSKSKIFYFNLDKQIEDLVSKLMTQFEMAELIKLENINEIIPYANKSEADRLILDANTNAKMLSEKKAIFSGKLLNTKLLWISTEGTTTETFDQKLVFDIVKKAEVLSLDVSLLRKISFLYDYVHENQEGNPKKDDCYIPLDLVYLSTINKSPCDIFLQISDKKYIKIINKDDDFKINEIIENYRNKNINDFFITFNNLTKFRDSILKNIFKFDESKGNLVSHQLKVSEAVLSIARDFGVTDFVIEGINDTCNEIYKEFNSSSKLKAFLDQMTKLEGTVIGNHSYLTSVFIAMIGSKVPWFNREVKKNLYTAAMLHDLDLNGTGYEQLEFKNINLINMLPNKEKDAVKNHAVALSKRLSKLDIIPSDVINLIAKHHEGAGPNSYPQGLHGPQLSPPICLFNVAHQFAIEMSNISFNHDKINQALDNVKSHLSGNSFKQFIDILEKEVSSN